MSLLNDDGFHSSAIIVELEKALMHKHGIPFSLAQKFVLEGRAQLGMSRWEPSTPELERICQKFCKENVDVTETTLDESSSEYIDDDGSVYIQEESSPGDQSKPWEVDASRREEYRCRKPREQKLRGLDPPAVKKADAGSVSTYQVRSDDQDDESLFAPDEDFSTLWVKEDDLYVPTTAYCRHEEDVEDKYDEYCGDEGKGGNVAAMPSVPTNESEQYAEVSSKSSQETDVYLSDTEKKGSFSFASGAIYKSNDEVHIERLEQGTGITSLSTSQSGVKLPEDKSAASSKDHENNLETVLHKESVYVPSNAVDSQGKAKENTTCKTGEVSNSTTVSDANKKEVPLKQVATSSHPTEIKKEEDSDEIVSSHSVASGVRAHDKYSEPPKVIYLLRQYMTEYIDSKKREKREAQRKIKSTLESKSRTGSVSPDHDKSQSGSTQGKNQSSSLKSLSNKSESCSLLSGSNKIPSGSMKSATSHISKTSSMVHVSGTRNVFRHHDSKRSVREVEMKRHSLIEESSQPSTKSSISRDAKVLKIQKPPKKKFPLFSLFKSSARSKDVQFISSTGHINEENVHALEQNLSPKDGSSSHDDDDDDVLPPVFSYVPSDDPSVGGGGDKFPVKEIAVTIDPDDSNQCAV